MYNGGNLSSLTCLGHLPSMETTKDQTLVLVLLVRDSNSGVCVLREFTSEGKK